MTQVTIFVCTACRQDDDVDSRPGQILLEELRARLPAHEQEIVAIEPVECLGVCKRPCTVALAAESKWTYVIGDLDAVGDVDELLTSARSFAARANGIVPWKERPNSFRKGVVSRAPPLTARNAKSE